MDQLPSFEETQELAPTAATAPEQAGGDALPSFDQTQDIPTDHSQYETTGQKVLTGIEGAAQGVAGPLATAGELGLSKLGVPGLSAEEQLGRAKANPTIHGVGEGVGFVGSLATGLGEAAVLGKLGAAAAGAVHAGEAVNLGAKLLKGATAAAAEMAALTSGNEASQWLLDDPDQTASTAMAHIGTATMLGAATGGIFSGIGAGINKILDNPTLKEFGDRLASPFSGVDAKEMVSGEAEDALTNFYKQGSEVTGSNGLKQQAIAKHLPEATPENVAKIDRHMDELVQQGAERIEAASKNAYLKSSVPKLTQDHLDFVTAIEKPGATPLDKWNALNEYKSATQGHINYEPHLAGVEEKKLSEFMRPLANTLKESGENSSIWGKAADLQRDLNASWTKVLPAVKDFQKKFAVKEGGVWKVSQDKLNTYLNQVAKATTETDKQRVLGNFVEKLSGHFEAVDRLYTAAGAENPFGQVGMSALKESVNIPSTGAKLADLVKQKLTAKAIGHTGGGVIGTSLGSAIGHPFLGGLIGERGLGPAFESMLKPILEKYPNVDVNALNTAMTLAQSVQKANRAITTGAAAIVSGAGNALSDSMRPTPKDIEALDEKAKAFKMTEPSDSGVSHYLPGHGAALAKSATQLITYVNSQRPNLVRANPFDAPPKMTPAQQYQFNRTLEIAQQPLMVYHHIQNGTLTAQDVGTLRAAHPALYNKLSGELMTAATNHIQKGETVPYKVQQSMSLFLGQPLASTLTPQAIQAAQGVFAAKAAQKAQMQEQASNEQKSGHKGTPKSAEMLMTGDQKRENSLAQKA